MKKIIIVAVCIFLLPALSFARDKTLYDIADDMITLAEATIDCAAAENACPEADAIALKEEAENGVKDIVGLIASGNLASMQLTIEQLQCLASRLEPLNSHLVHVEMFAGACNAGIVLIYSTLDIIGLGYYIFAWGITAIMSMDITGTILIVAGIAVMVAGVMAISVGCLLLLTCLLWWL